MIDKSIRQYYQEGENVNQLKKWTKQLTGKYFPQDETGLDERQLLKNVASSAVKNLATRKLATQLGGTGILSSLGPIGMLIAAILARKGVEYAKGKVPKDIQQALTQGFTGLGVGSPEEQRELRQLENRRANMLQRKEEGKNYSEKNLDIVTRAIAEAKGLDINNPNEMRNIDKPITQIQIEKRVTDPVITHPTFTGEGRQITTPKTVEETAAMEDIITRPTVEKTAAMEDIITRPTVEKTAAMEDIIAPPVWNPGIAAQEEAAANRAAEEKAAANRAMQETIAKAEKEAAAARAYTPPVRHHTGGGNGGGNGGSGGMGKGQDPGGGAAGSPFLKGGRVDKALGGRSRDI